MNNELIPKTKISLNGVKNGHKLRQLLRIFSQFIPIYDQFLVILAMDQFYEDYNQLSLQINV